MISRSKYSAATVRLVLLAAACVGFGVCVGFWIF